MTNKPKIAPPAAPHKAATAQAFVQGATVPKNTVQYPWEADIVRDDVTKVFNLRLQEKYHLMLKYIASQPDHKSAQSFLQPIVKEAIEKEVARLKKLNRI